MLNETLRDQVIAFINGNMINKSGVFQTFNILVISQITFKLQHHTFSIDDPMMEEGTPGHRMYYVTKGGGILLHKKTRTFIKEIKPESCVGELAFFSGQNRRATLRSNTFTEVLHISRSTFQDIAELDSESSKILKMIRNKIKKRKNLSSIGVVCYICQCSGHISLDCKNYHLIEGNILKHIKSYSEIPPPIITLRNPKGGKNKYYQKRGGMILNKEDTKKIDDHIRDAIKNTLHTKKQIDLNRIEDLVDRNKIDEKVFQEMVNNRKRRLRRAKKSRWWVRFLETRKSILMTKARKTLKFESNNGDVPDIKIIGKFDRL